jgi:phosphatidylinositol-4-phosphate 3-kinase
VCSPPLSPTFPSFFPSTVTTTVEHVLMQAFCKLEDQIAGHNPSDYLLKTIGVQEFLSPKTRLSHLEFIHNSIKLEKDVQLGLCPRSDKYMKVIARTARDDYRDSELKLENILPKEPTSTIGYDNLMILLETLEQEIDRLESSADTVSPHVVLSCSGVVQGVKAICALLGSIDTLEVAHAVEKLRGVCANGEYRSWETPDIVSEEGDYAEVKLRPKTVNEHVRLHCNLVRNAVRNLLEIYAQAFRVNFCVDRPAWTTSE